MASFNKKNDNRTSFNLKKQMNKVETGVRNGVFVFTGPLSIEDFSKQVNKNTAEIVKHFFMHGRITNPNTILSENDIGELCLEWNLDFEKKKQVDETNILSNLNIEEDPANLKKRPPVVTIMGHVDHGKTTLLDYIRKTHVTKGEAGGITQHIGAYQISYKGDAITFLDTPGHEAFSAMRARGANATDIVVLVVAADDGIKPQTVEAIDHAKSAGVPIIVFINKMDKPHVTPETAMSQLTDKGLTPEEWGGDTITIKGSGVTGQNVDKLLESILAIAEVYEYKANPNTMAMGIVIESSLDKGLGNVATLLVKSGTLKKGDFLIAGSSIGHVRMMFDENLKEVKEALPSTPVKITGLNSTPDAGEKFIVSNNEAEIKEIARKIELSKRTEHLYSMQSNFTSSEDGGKILNLIIKADVSGTLEAIKGLLSKIEVAGAKIQIVRSSVGGITDTDVNLAKTAKAIIIGFNIKPSRALKDSADKDGIKILFYNIIYRLKEDVEKFLEGSLDPVMVEKETGEAKVQQIWSHSAIGTIAGCICLNGEIKRNDSARVLRDGKVLFDTQIGSMKHMKDFINKVQGGMEFGITLEKFNDLRVDDIIQCYRIVQEGK